MKKIGLFFGSFNPIHIGHLIMGNYMADCTDLNEVWYIVSPHNPLKKKASLLADYHRLAMVKEAVEGNDRLKASAIEFDLPQPSYTVLTLHHLKERYPHYTFVLIMGEDNLQTLHKWRNYTYILAHYSIYVYPRLQRENGSTLKKRGGEALVDLQRVTLFKDAPLMKLSSSYIRNAVRAGNDVRYLLPDPVWNYLDEMNFYK